MRRPGGNKVYETFSEAATNDVLVRPARKREKPSGHRLSVRLKEAEHAPHGVSGEVRLSVGDQTYAKLFEISAISGNAANGAEAAISNRFPPSEHWLVMSGADVVTAEQIAQVSLNKKPPRNSFGGGFL